MTGPRVGTRVAICAKRDGPSDCADASVLERDRSEMPTVRVTNNRVMVIKPGQVPSIACIP